MKNVRLGVAMGLAGLVAVSANAFDDLTASVRAKGAATVSLINGTLYNETSYPISNAFNGDTVPKQGAGRVLVNEAPSDAKPIIIRYDISEDYAGPTEVSAFKLIIAGDPLNGATRAPKYYSLEASETGADDTWVTLVDIDATAAAELADWSNVAPLVQDRTHYVPVAKRGSYRHYRFVCTANNGGKDVVHYSFTELIFYTGGPEVTVPSGDVAALTNAVAWISGLSADARGNARILLEPGLYDLTEGPMHSASYLQFSSAVHDGLLAGLGDGPGKTILKGGGEAGGRRVIYLLNGGGTDSFFTVSNLTVTGGSALGTWALGGGIQGSGTVVYRNLIVTNNYAQHAGGGCFEGRMYDCLVADNSAGGYGAGFYTKGTCGGFPADSVTQGAWDCLFRNNATPVIHICGGGGMVLNGKCVRCRFVGNSATYGGAVAVRNVDDVTSCAEIRDCTFIDNGSTYSYGEGSAVLCATTKECAISNSTFAANGKGGVAWGTIFNCRLSDCTITNNVTARSVIMNSSLVRCYVARNATTNDVYSVDAATTAGMVTNVNCLFEDNLSCGVHITAYKTVLNCTYVANRESSGDAGILGNCAVWNTILSGNTVGGNPLDVRTDYGTGAFSLALTNCVFTASDTTVDHEGFKGCKLVPSVRFRATETGGPYDLASGSPARDAACVEDWMTPLLGATDFAGRPRYALGTLDVGALECQKIDGFVLMVR